MFRARIKSLELVNGADPASTKTANGRYFDYLLEISRKNHARSRVLTTLGDDTSRFVRFRLLLGGVQVRTCVMHVVVNNNGIAFEHGERCTFHGTAAKFLGVFIA